MNGRAQSDIDALPAELRLAAIITLLSSTALHGATVGKVEALRSHLEAAALCREPLDPHLRQALEDAFAHWLTVEVDGPASSPTNDDGWQVASSRRLH